MIEPPPEFSPEEWAEIPESARAKILQRTQETQSSPTLKYTSSLIKPIESLDRMVAWVLAQSGRPRQILSWITPLYRLLVHYYVVVEISIVVVVAILAAGKFLDTDPLRQLPGHEAEWLTSSAYGVMDGLEHNGWIPLWQPYLNWGEPLVENPFSFVFNPLTMAPVFAYGARQGILLSVVIYAVFAGLGGWFLGRILKFGMPARLLLALLMIGKGNMVGMIGTGYYQLGVAQAYFPWVIGGALVTLREGRRWAIALTAISFTLMFWAGNIWYTLPTLIALILLTWTHVYFTGSQNHNWAAFRNMVLAGLFTIGLSAIVLIPLWVHQGNIGGHSNDLTAGTPVDFLNMVRQYFDGDPLRYADHTAPGEMQFYHAFVIPIWFAILIGWAVLTLRSLRTMLPSLKPLTIGWRVWAVAVFMLISSTVWAAGGNPIFVFLYNAVPLLSQWRFVGRAMAVGAFWLAVLLAAGFDRVWQTIIVEFWEHFQIKSISLRWQLGIALLIMGALAAYPVVAQWSTYSGTQSVSTYDPQCLAWFSEQYPNQPLTLYVTGYQVVVPFVENHIRLHDIEADYRAESIGATIGDLNLWEALPPFGLAHSKDDGLRLESLGYTVIENSPKVDGTNSCLYQLATPSLPYTFTASRDDLVAVPFNTSLSAEQATAAALISRRNDHIQVQVSNAPDKVLVVQEAAYPGWEVKVDDQPAALESVGKMIGVVLPSDTATHLVTFVFRPPLFYLSGWLTVLTALIMAIYLSGIDKLLRRLGGRKT